MKPSYYAKNFLRIIGADGASRQASEREICFLQMIEQAMEYDCDIRITYGRNGREIWSLSRRDNIPDIPAETEYKPKGNLI